MREQFLDGQGSLVPREQWVGFINSLKQETKLKTKEEAKAAVKEALINAVKLRATCKFGVMFSGGVDSVTIALILKQLGFEFTCYSVGVENSKDLAYAERIAKDLNLNLKKKILSDDDIDKTLDAVTEILKDADYVNVSIATVSYEAIQLAKKDEITTMFTGLGSEEIFAGYYKHLKSKDLDTACWEGLAGIWKQDLLRDTAVAKATNIELKTPFLDKELIKVAMTVPSKFKVVDELKKVILREVALDLRLPEEYAMRKKVAAQYGSGFNKAIKRVARSKGFKFKSDYVRELKSN